MKLKVGDKVKFLNQSGGGIVTRILNSNMVNVAIEDGFEIPTLINELIRMDEGAGAFFNENYQIDIPAKEEEKEIAEHDSVIPIMRFQSANTYPPGIYLAFVPQDQKWLLTGLLDIYLINNTPYDIIYSLFYKEGDLYEGSDYDVVSVESMMLMETVSREELDRWSNAAIQILFHKDKTARLLMPVQANIKIRPARFYNDSLYKDSNFFNERACIVMIHELSKAPVAPLAEKEEKYDSPVPVVSKPKPAVPVSLIDKHRISARVAEVDLHISALMDNYTDLTNHEILTIQINYFERTLNSAIENHYYKVYYIHGIGNGTLRNAIISHLRGYGNIELRDAPFEKYGTGAMEVVIRENG